METLASDPNSALLQRVRSDLESSERETLRLDRVNTRLISSSLVTSALATAIAGMTAAMGPLAGSGPPAWRWSCGAIAGVTALSGLLTGAHQRLNVAERLARVRACTGQLRALELAVGVRGQEAGEGLRRYEELVAQYPELSARA